MVLGWVFQGYVIYGYFCVVILEIYLLIMMFVLYQYVIFFKDIVVNGKVDGIVMWEDMMDEFVVGIRRGSMFIYEVGYWLGFYYIFGEVVFDVG